MKEKLEAERFSQIVFYGTVLLIGYLGWRIVQPFLPAIGWAVVMAICLEPVRARVAPRLGRTRTALLLSLLVVVLLVVPVVFIGATLVNEGPGAVDYVGQQLQNQGGPGARFHAAWGWLRVRAPFLPGEQDVIARITASLGSFVQFLAGQAGGLLASAAGFVFALAITIAVLFFLLRDASDLAGTVRRILPFGAEQNERLIGMAYDLVTASVTATVAIAVAQGAIGGVTFALLGIRGAVLWGVMMGLLSFLPLIGTALVWAPAAIWLALSGSLTKGIVLAAVGLGIMGQVDNVVRPLLLSGKAQLSTLVLIISLMGGVSAFGLIGIVLGPLVAALLTALFESSEGSLPGGGSPPGGPVAALGDGAAAQSTGATPPATGSKP
jgi:predicted PurR-regulated permease PerM